MINLCGEKMTIDETIDEIYENDAERAREIVLEFIELDSENLMLEEILIDGVQRIDFTEPDAWLILAKLIEDNSNNSVMSRDSLIVGHCVDLINGEFAEYDKVCTKKHEDIEFLLEQPWKSSALRKLWKAIISYEFRTMWNEGDGLPLVVSVLEILLLATDESAFVPYVEVYTNASEITVE